MNDEVGKAEILKRIADSQECQHGHLARKCELCLLIEENRQLKSLCEGVSTDLSEIMNREEGRLRPSARGDIDNARLTLLLASES
jgi:hypothetical protein